MQRLFLSAAVTALALAASPANAAVRYDFQAFSSFPLGEPQDVVTGNFSLTLADFITSSTTVPFAGLSSCSATGSVTGVMLCGEQTLSPVEGFNDFVGFGFFQPLGFSAVYYYFTPGALSAVGTYDTVLFGQEQAGRLTVSVVGGAVPEPGSWAMMIAGFGLVGGVMRRKNTLSVTKVSYG
jgi:hypothetical protein